MKYAKKRNPFTKYWLRRKFIRKFVNEIKSYRQNTDDFMDCCFFDEYAPIREDVWNRLKIILP